MRTAEEEIAFLKSQLLRVSTLLNDAAEDIAEHTAQLKEHTAQLGAQAVRADVTADEVAAQGRKLVQLAEGYDKALMGLRDIWNQIRP